MLNTRKRCRKLHLINERFMHRSNLPSGMYESQTQSKSWRQMKSVYGRYLNLIDCMRNCIQSTLKRIIMGNLRGGI